MHDSARDIMISCSVEPPIQFRKFKNAPPTAIHGLSFEYTRYKIGEKKGQPRLEQSCRDNKGEQPSVLAKAPMAGQAHQYERLVGVPSEVRDAIPLIYIGTNRSLREQLPSARYSLLRQMFEDINRRLQDTNDTVTVKRDDGTESQVPRVEHFRSLMKSALMLLRTDAFRQVETAIKKNVLRQLGFDPMADAGKLICISLRWTVSISTKPWTCLLMKTALRLARRKWARACKTPSCSPSCRHSRRPRNRARSCLSRSPKCSCIPRCSVRFIRPSPYWREKPSYLHDPFPPFCCRS